MLTKLDPKSGLPHVHEIRPDLKNIGDVEKEIEMELLNGFLFASDDVLKSMADFIRGPNHTTYVKTAVSMRRDLWGRKTSVDEQVVTIFHNDKSN